MGHFVEKVDGVVVREGETYTCAHCNNVFEMHPKQTQRAFCLKCMKRTCISCDAKPCVPFEEKLRRVEARARFLRSVFKEGPSR